MEKFTFEMPHTEMINGKMVVVEKVQYAMGILPQDNILYIARGKDAKRIKFKHDPKSEYAWQIQKTQVKSHRDLQSFYDEMKKDHENGLSFAYSFINKTMEITKSY